MISFFKHKDYPALELVKYESKHFDIHMRIIKESFKIIPRGYIESVMHRGSEIVLIRSYGKIVGTFEVVDRNLRSFAILRKYRGKGIGTAVITALLDRYGEISIFGPSDDGRFLYRKFPHRIDYSDPRGEIWFLTDPKTSMLCDEIKKNEIYKVQMG